MLDFSGGFREYDSKQDIGGKGFLIVILWPPSELLLQMGFKL